MADKRGVVLVTTIIVLIFLSVLGMSLIAFLFSRFSYSQIQMDRLKALYLAEAGLSQAIWELKTNYDDPESERAPGNIPWRDVSDGPLVYGRYKTTHDFQTSTITSTAEVDKLQRTIQIKYASL